MMQLNLDADALRPLVALIVSEVLQQLQDARLGPGQPEQLAYTEAQAAKLLGLQRHQLRDARLRGEIPARRRGGEGSRVMYTKADLQEYLTKRQAG